MHITRRSQIYDTTDFLESVYVNRKDDMRVVDDEPADAITNDHRLCHIAEFHRVGAIENLVLYNLCFWIIIR